MVTRDLLTQEIGDRFQFCLALMQRKNKDYANEKDAFANFRLSEMVGVGPERANLVRVADKLARISNLLDKENAVTDESVEDTINDVINYMAILASMIKHKKDA